MISRPQTRIGYDQPMRRVSPLWLILLAYLMVASAYAYFTPAWEAPDEPAHYNYIRQLAAGHLPVIEPGDYNQSYLVEVAFEAHFAPEYSLDPLQYEDWQPPLYYLLLAPLYWVADGSLLALRLFSLLLGAVVVALAYQIASRLFPARRWIAVTSAAFIAFVPQHVAVLASLNNDSLAELLIAAILLRLVEWLRAASGRSTPTAGQRYLLELGFLLGLGFLTKATVYPLALVVGLVVWRHLWPDWQRIGRASLATSLPAIALGALWWGRNIAIYGGLDILGKAAHDRVVVGQPRTVELVANLGLSGALNKFVKTTFDSFWGQFGWMTVPLPGWIYRLLWGFSFLVAAGLLRLLIRRYYSGAALPENPEAGLPGRTFMLLSTFLFAVGVLVGYNFTFEQHQGRYLFPALIPIGIGVALGLGVWLEPICRRWPYSAQLLPGVLALALIALDYWALFRVILPALG